MTEPTISPLTELDCAQGCDVSAEQIGGKAASLLTMKRAGLPVPMAWVLPIPVCTRYFAEGRSLSADLLHDIQSAVQTMERAAGKSLGNRPQDLQLAVRSGAAASMPGTMESVLHIGTWEELDRAISTVLDSWMSPAAVAFRRARNLEHLGGTAVIVQQMIDTVVAGVMFTRDPLNPHAEALIIEAVDGTGDRLVSGAASGQRWTILEQAIEDAVEPIERAESSLLDQQQLRELAQHGRRIEHLLRQPADIEWGLTQDGQWHFFQARPIVFPGVADETKPARSAIAASNDATGSEVDSLSKLLAQENIRLDRFRGQGEVIWVRHNLCETLPYPTPLTWSILRDFLSGSGGYGSLYRRLGFSPSRRIRQHGFAELIGGQVYASSQRLPDLFCIDFPFSFDTDELQRDPSAIDRAPNRLDLDRVGPWFLLRSPWILWILWRARRRLDFLRKHVVRSFHDELLPKYHRYLAQEQNQSLDSLSTSELVILLERRMQQVLQEFAPQLLLPGVVGAAVLEMLRQRVNAISNDAQGDELCQTLLQKLSVPLLTEMQQAAEQLRDRQLSESEFLARFGHRGRHEMELAEPRWSESPDQILDVASNSAANTPAGGAELMAQMEEFRERNAARLPPRLSSLFSDAVRMLPYREIGKHEFLRGYALLREAAQALGRATGLGDEIYFLTLEEAGRLDRETTHRLVNSRKQERELWRRFSVPAVIDEQGLSQIQPRRTEGEVVLRGMVISRGIGHGTAWFPDRHLQQPPPQGSILICPTLPPHFVAFFTDAAAVVVDQSALLSHGAILARQFGIPVVCHPEATRIICDHDLIHVDGDTGRIRIQRDSA